MTGPAVPSGLANLLEQAELLREPHARLIALAPDAVRLLIDMAAAVETGYWDETTDEWRCAMCDATEGHADGCSYGDLLARFAALNQKAGTA